MIEAREESPGTSQGVYFRIIQNNSRKIRAQQIPQLLPRLDGRHTEVVHRSVGGQQAQLIAADQGRAASVLWMDDLDQLCIDDAGQPSAY